MAERWVTRNEAAKRAGVHYNTIRKWQQLGYFEEYEIKQEKRGAEGTEWFYDISALDRIIADRHTVSRLSESDTRERLAALEAENAELRRQLAKADGERRELLERILKIAGSEGG